MHLKMISEGSTAKLTRGHDKNAPVGQMESYIWAYNIMQRSLGWAGKIGKRLSAEAVHHRCSCDPSRSSTKAKEEVLKRSTRVVGGTLALERTRSVQLTSD